MRKELNKQSREWQKHWVRGGFIAGIQARALRATGVKNRVPGGIGIPDSKAGRRIKPVQWPAGEWTRRTSGDMYTVCTSVSIVADMHVPR